MPTSALAMMTGDPDHMTLETSRSRGTVGGRLQRREETLEFVIRFAKSQVWESQPLSVAKGPAMLSVTKFRKSSAACQKSEKLDPEGSK